MVCVVIVAAGFFVFFLPSVFRLGNSNLNPKEELHSVSEKTGFGIYKGELRHRHFPTWLNSAASPNRSVTVLQEQL